MRRVLCIMLAAVMLICMPSCQKPDETVGNDSGEHDAVSGAVGENDPPKTPENYAEKYSALYSDDTVYNTNMYTGYSLYFTVSVKRSDPSVKTLAEVLLDSPGEALYAHEDPTCRHSDGTCPMAMENCRGTSQKTLIVNPKTRKLPIVYYFNVIMVTAEETVEGFYGDNGNLEIGDTVKFTEVREYDVETGDVRVVATIPYSRVLDAWCYRGKLYLQSERTGGRYRFGAVDLATGEFKDTEIPESVYMIGITNGRIWYISVYNIIGSCSPQLTDYRDEYNIGASECRKGYLGNTLCGRAGDGVIYYERDCRHRDELADDPNTDWYMVSDLYMLKADDIEAGAVSVAKDVLAFDICEGDLYYTQFDYKEFGMTTLDGGKHEFMMRSYDGGSLYKYDHNTGENVTCYKDIGVGVEWYPLDLEVVDGKAIFYGLRYRDFEGCESYDGRDNICVADIETGKWFPAYSSIYMIDE